MQTGFFKGLLFVAMLVLFVQCRKDDHVDLAVYVTGYEANADGVDVPKLWVNGVEKVLPLTFELKEIGASGGYPQAVYVQGSDVYVTGHEVRYGVSHPLVWKNNVLDWESVNQWSYAYDIYVDAKKAVYIAGRTYDNTLLKSGATILKNGAVTYLTNDNEDDYSFAFGLFADGNDMYAAGNKDESKAILWKNGNPAELGEGTAYSVYSTGGDVYVAGYLKNSKGNEEATLWKNGVASSLFDDSEISIAYSVYVSGNDVYVAGRYGDHATLWKNNVATDLGEGIAHAVYVSGSDVYVSGESGNRAVYWKNGIPTYLSDGTYYAIANDIIIAKGN